jgi:hypothetical protein
LPTDPSKAKYVFKLVTKAFKVIYFEADFTGSEECLFEEEKGVEAMTHSQLRRKDELNTSSLGQHSGNKRIFSIKKIKPIHNKGVVELQTKRIVTVSLQQNWKLQSNFTFKLSNPSETQ